VIRRLTLLLALVALLAVAGCGDDDSDSDGGGGDTTSASEQQECTTVQAPEPKEDGGQSKPTEKLDPAKTYDVTFTTNCGDFTFRLDVEQAPNTTASFAALVRDGFYDGTTFHRVVPGFVIQGGDPTGTGMGGPGYKTVDKPPAGTKYTPGVVAMAKTAAEPAGTSGSQFYVVSGPDAGALPADYAVIGEITEGMDTVARIDALGNASDPAGTPVQPVVVEKATLSES
jgi:peptidyl-prolyl cis-trans isomerase B (cyclophilin B)